MAYDDKKLAPVGAVSPAAPTLWSYKTDDLIATVKASGYFDEAATKIREHDIIWVSALDFEEFIDWGGVGMPSIPAIEIPLVVVEISANYDVTTLDDVIVFTGSPTITLLAEPTKPIIIKNDGVGTGTIDGNGAAIEAPSTISASVARRLIKTSIGWRDIT